MLTVASLPLALVYPRDEGRPVIREKVAVLAESLRALGLRSPITVRACQKIRNGQPADAYEIVAGRHRYEAAVKLQWEEIDAIVMEGEPDDCELWEIDENFARAELTEAQKADHHARRRRILIAKGIVSDSKGGPKTGSDKNRYADEAAQALGVSPETIKKHVWRGNKIEPEVLAALAGTELDTGVVLDELATTPRENQRARLAEIAHRRSTVRLAPDPLNDPEAHEKQLAALMSAWNRAAGPVRQEFMLRIDTPVFDRGAA